ncbi:MAG: hypothetical protein AB1641_10805 [Thermodesulfobacteriota bacterium]
MKRILVYFQQVGGVQALWPWLTKIKAGYSLILAARAVVRHRKPDLDLSSVNDLGWNPDSEDPGWLARLGADLVVTDTMNLARDPEGIHGRLLWTAAGKTGIPILAYVDSWWGYIERFLLPGETSPPVLPDVIGVVDDLARRQMIGLGFDPRPIRVLGCPRFETMAAAIERNGFRVRLGLAPENLFLVFVSQPLEKALRGLDDWGFTEKTILRALVHAVNALPEDLRRRMVFGVLLHPEEESPDLTELTRGLDPMVRCRFFRENPNLDLIRAADLVVGMFSILLTEAVIIKRPVLSVQLGLKREDMLVTNMVGATVPVRRAEELSGALSGAIGDVRVRLEMLERQARFQIVGDSIQRWQDAVEELLAVRDKTAERQKLNS